MKLKGKIENVRIAQGRELASGKTAVVRHHYYFALYCEKDSYEGRSWKNFGWEPYHEPGFTERVAELFTEFHELGWAHGLITLSDAPTYTEGLALVQLEGVELRKFLIRHPLHTLKVIATFGESDGTLPREYVGDIVGGDGFCTDEKRRSEA